jgi:hypothetical protein
MEYFKSIDTLPIWNFYKVKESGDLRFMFKDEADYEVSEIRTKLLAEMLEVWKQIESDFTNDFGMTENFINRLILEKRVMRLELDYYCNKTAGAKGRFEQEKRMFESGGDVKFSFEETIANIEMFAKFSIDERKCSTKRFFSYINLMRVKNKTTSNG